MNKQLKTVFAAAFCGVLVLSYTWYSRTSRLSPFLQGVGDSRQISDWTDEKTQREVRTREAMFADTWRYRNSRNILPDLERYLNDPSVSIRNSAVRAVGWLQNPDGIDALKSMNKRIVGHQEKEVTPQAVLLALGRIEGRDKHGQERLDKLVLPLKLSWSDVCDLSARINSPVIRLDQDRDVIRKSPAHEIVQATVDVLYSMAKHGEDIRNFERQMSLSPVQSTYLELAPMSDKEEASSLLSHYVLKQTTNPLDDGEDLLCNHLIGLGKVGEDQIIDLLRKVSADPNKFFPEPSKTRGYVNLLRAAERTRRPDALPLLRRLSKHPYKWVAYYARQSADRLDRRESFPYFPA